MSQMCHKYQYRLVLILLTSLEPFSCEAFGCHWFVLVVVVAGYPPPQLQLQPSLFYYNLQFKVISIDNFPQAINSFALISPLISCTSNQTHLLTPPLKHILDRNCSITLLMNGATTPQRPHNQINHTLSMKHQWFMQCIQKMNSCILTISLACFFAF